MKFLQRLFGRRRKNDALGYHEFSTLYVKADKIRNSNLIEIDNLVVSSNYQKSYYDRLKEVLTNK